MSKQHQIEILARGDVRSLARVVDVLALLEVTPLSLHSFRDAEGMRIRLRFAADARQADLCRARLRQLVVVKALSDCGVSSRTGLPRREAVRCG